MKNGAVTPSAPFFSPASPAAGAAEAEKETAFAHATTEAETRRTGNAQRQIFKRLVGVVGEAERMDRALLLPLCTQTSPDCRLAFVAMAPSLLRRRGQSALVSSPA
jgi:hypothetical protein